MRVNLSLILIGLFFLSACGGNAPATTAPTADSSSVTTDSSGTAVPATVAGLQATPDLAATQSAEPTLIVQERSFSTDEPPLPIPGTIIAPITPDPDAGLIFDIILLERTGGLAGIPLTIEVKGDGTVTRDGVASTISPDQVTFLDNLLDQLNFFGLQGVFTAPGTSADTYHYAVTVERAGSSRTIRAEDGFLPSEMIQLLSLLSDLGAPTQ
jgi:hypothetical protein